MIIDNLGQLAVASWAVMVTLAPWLLLGMGIAGVLHVILPADFVRQQLSGAGGVIKAVALGVPLPLCSCGVIPAGLGLKRDGADDGATVGFLISTPQTGVDSILVSASFLGWPFAIFKLASAAITGVVGGALSNVVSSTNGASDVNEDGSDAGDVAAGKEEETPDLSEMFGHAVGILRTIWRWLILGIAVSALIEVYLPERSLALLSAEYGTLSASLAMLVVSVPLYVCASASVPIAAALVGSGMPAGAALVFLMAGPATNVATIGAVYRALGGRVLAVYLATIIVGSMVGALAFEHLVAAGVTPTAMVHAHHEHGFLATLSAVALSFFLVYFAYKDLESFMDKQKIARAQADGATPVIEVAVTGMRCGGCVSNLRGKLSDDERIESATVSLEPGKAIVQGKITEAELRELVVSAGFEAN